MMAVKQKVPDPAAGLGGSFSSLLLLILIEDRR